MQNWTNQRRRRDPRRISGAGISGRQDCPGQPARRPPPSTPPTSSPSGARPALRSGSPRMRRSIAASAKRSWRLTGSLPRRSRRLATNARWRAGAGPAARSVSAQFLSRHAAHVCKRRKGGDRPLRPPLQRVTTGISMPTCGSSSICRSRIPKHSRIRSVPSRCAAISTRTASRMPRATATSSSASDAFPIATGFSGARQRPRNSGSSMKVDIPDSDPAHEFRAMNGVLR